MNEPQAVMVILFNLWFAFFLWFDLISDWLWANTATNYKTHMVMPKNMVNNNKCQKNLDCYMEHSILDKQISDFQFVKEILVVKRAERDNSSTGKELNIIYKKGIAQ